jgi:hypothetical protein
MMTRLAAEIVRHYPAPWRERYEGEVLSLIEESPVRFADFGELVRGLIVERAKALIEDADHPRRTVAILSCMQTVFALGFVSTAWGVGALLRSSKVLGQPPEYLGSLVGGVSACAFGVASIACLYRQQTTQLSHRALFSARTSLALLPVVFVISVIIEWGFVPSPYSPVVPSFEYGLNVFRNLFYQGVAAGFLSAAFWPGRRLLHTLGRLNSVNGSLASAQTWVDGCHTMIAQGVPSPLDEAQGHVDRLSRERSDVLAQLQNLGYKARFR